VSGWGINPPEGYRDAERATVSWHRSSHSQDGACVEVARVPGQVLVRDSKDPDGPILSFTFAEWHAFLAGVSGGEFELP
jgi:hypothetical protein